MDQVDDLHGYVENETFPEVPDHILQPSSWHTVGMGMWKHTDEHITMKEATCLLLAVRRMSRPRRHRHRRHLIFLDNLALRFALGKGRSQNYGMLRILQQIGSISLACALTLQSRWIPNEKNVADGPSRGQIALGAVSQKLRKSCAKELQVIQANVANSHSSSCFNASQDLAGPFVEADAGCAAGKVQGCGLEETFASGGGCGESSESKPSLNTEHSCTGCREGGGHWPEAVASLSWSRRVSA